MPSTQNPTPNTRAEWLLTNGIGGFSSASLSGAATRRYHALLVAALDPPAGRMAMLASVDETVVVDGRSHSLATHLYTGGAVFPDGWTKIARVQVTPESVVTEYQLPGGATISRKITMPAGENAVRIEYASDRNMTLRVAPMVLWKDSHAQMRRWNGFPFRGESAVNGWEIQPTDDSPTLFLRLFGARWEPAGWWNERIFHPVEAARGFDATEETFCPAVAEIALSPGSVATFHAGILGERARDVPKVGAPFVVSGVGRKTVLAGYPWFTDWGRDTFLSLPGLCLNGDTGGVETAREIVESFAPWIENGRIPNRFPDRPEREAPAYNNVDGTLWYVRAIGLTAQKIRGDAFAKKMTPVVKVILDTHLAGEVGDGIFCDGDGLLRAGNESTNLTWMDAKVRGVPVTPRFDRPVEVQALWIHALSVGAKLTGDARYDETRARALKTFAARFVRADNLGLYDCLLIDGGADRSIRPNMVLAAALLHRELPETVLRAVCDTATEHLLTPFGLRTLSPGDPRYVGNYGGDSARRDGAYHQGTVWPWLLGSYLSLKKRLGATDSELDALVQPLENHRQSDYGIGGIAEIFSGDPPHAPDGCPWQAWSEACLREGEVVR